MDKTKRLEKEIDLPEGTTFTKENRIIKVKGPKGEVERTLADQNLIIKQEGNKINLSYDKTGRKQKAYLHTTWAHIKNMVKGANEGYTYKLKICSGHFPMNVALKGDTLEIKNFIGEKVPRTLKILPDVTVKVNGDNIEVTGINKEKTGQTAASIEKLTKRPGFDKRIFQDGIYITEKDGKTI